MIDSHAHLDSRSFDADRDDVIRRAFDSGIERFVQIGVQPASWRDSIALADRYPGRIRVLIGLCPHESALFSPEILDTLSRTVLDRTYLIAGIGEIGLEYHYDIPHNIQMESFKAQLKLAGELRLPISIHTREAEADTLRLLSDEADRRGGQLDGLIHCFTGGPEFAGQCLALGLDISFSGIVTFATAPEVAAAADIVPIDRIHIETDSPYLVPRNCPVKTRRCEPAFIRYTGEFIAVRRKISPDEFIRQCATNTRRLFFPNVSEATE